MWKGLFMGITVSRQLGPGLLLLYNPCLVDERKCFVSNCLCLFLSLFLSLCPGIQFVLSQGLRIIKYCLKGNVTQEFQDPLARTRGHLRTSERGKPDADHVWVVEGKVQPRGANLHFREGETSLTEEHK